MEREAHGPRWQSGEHSLSLRNMSEKLIFEEFRPHQKAPGSQVDLTGVSDAQIISSCLKLVGSGLVVLHGSSAPHPAALLKSHQANDAAKESGNQKAVYATVELDVALFYALVNRYYVQSHFFSFALGYGLYRGKRVFKATSNLYKLFVQRDPYLYSDGFIYLLDKSAFTRALDSATEYQSVDSQTPLCVLKVPKRLGDSLLIVGEGEDRDTLIQYSAQETAEINAR